MFSKRAILRSISYLRFIFINFSPLNHWAHNQWQRCFRSSMVSCWNFFFSFLCYIIVQYIAEWCSTFPYKIQTKTMMIVTFSKKNIMYVWLTGKKNSLISRINPINWIFAFRAVSVDANELNIYTWFTPLFVNRLLGEEKEKINVSVPLYYCNVYRKRNLVGNKCTVCKGILCL